MEARAREALFEGNGLGTPGKEPKEYESLHHSENAVVEVTTLSFKYGSLSFRFRMFKFAGETMEKHQERYSTAKERMSRCRHKRNT